MQKPDRRWFTTELRIALIFLLFYALVRLLPLYTLGRHPLRPTDYVVGIGFALRLALGFRSVLPSLFVGLLIYCTTMRPVSGAITAGGYTCAYAVGMWVILRHAGPAPWLTTTRSVLAVFAGSALACAISAVGNATLIDPNPPGTERLIVVTRIFSDISRELSGMLALTPVILVLAVLPLRRFCCLPVDERSASRPGDVFATEAILASVSSILVLAVTVLYRNAVGLDLVILGFAPLVILAASFGLRSASLALAMATLAGGLLWSSLANSTAALPLADLRLIVLAASVTTVVTAQHVERRREARHLLQARIAELRQFTSKAQDAREAERTRLAREVHDELGQLLTGLKMNLKMTAAGFRTVPEAELSAAAAEVDAILVQTERIGHELAPELMDNPESLIDTLRRVAESSEERFGFHVTVEGDDVAFAPGPRYAVCRIVQEALTNVARHAGATRVYIRLRQTGSNVQLEVEDDGKGIAAEQTARKGLGVVGMKERAALLGGTLQLHSAPARGTRVTLIVPGPA